jgi:hypothetical protein
MSLACSPISHAYRSAGIVAKSTVRCFLLAFLPHLALSADVLDEIAPAAVVCVGTEAPGEERQAANLIFGALRERSDSAQLLSDEQVLATPVAVSGKWHVIAVGRPVTNRVLLTYPSYWSLDRELYYAPLGHMPAAPFTETRGFYISGFGYFFAGRNVGFVEFDRSPFYSDMVFSLSAKERDSVYTPPSLRFLIRVTGSTPEGVLIGAKRFVDTKMLYGLAIGPPRWPRSHDLWNLDDENVRPGPPGWVPNGRYSRPEPGGNEGTISFLGWLMADRTMYAGFLEVTTCKPAQMWRVKYQTEAGLVDFNRSPHHRASDNELLIVRLSSREDAQRACRSLRGTIPIAIAGRTWYRTDNLPAERAMESSRDAEGRMDVVRGPSRTHILATEIGGEAYLILANFDEEHAAIVMREVGNSLPVEE